mgnify:CR=1 FL=1
MARAHMHGVSGDHRNKQRRTQLGRPDRTPHISDRTPDYLASLASLSPFYRK